MRALIAPAVLAATLAAALAACSGPDEAASAALIARFHAAIDANDTAAIDAMLTRSTRNLRPGSGIARAFRVIPQRHGRYLGGAPASISSDAGHTRIIWAARYERQPIREYFVLVEEDGALKVDSYSDNAGP